jgi:hypothetical protein
MPTDISGAVAAEYTETIPVPLDGEYANSTALQAMVLPLANRIEYLNQGLIEAPFEQPFIREDWFSVEKVGSLVHGDTGPWNYAESAAAFSDPLQSSGSATSGSAGMMRFENASGTAAVAEFRKKCLIARNKVRRLSARIHMLSTTTNKSFFLGMTNLGGGTTIGSGDTSAFGVIYDPAVHANIRTVGVSGGVYTYTDTGVPPAAGTHYQLDIEQDPNTLAMTLNIQGSGAYAIAGLPAIGTDLIPVAKLGSTNSGSRQFNWDLFYLGLNVARY